MPTRKASASPADELQEPLAIQPVDKPIDKPILYLPYIEPDLRWGWCFRSH